MRSPPWHRLASIAAIFSFVSVARAQDAGVAPIAEPLPEPVAAMPDDPEPVGPTPEQEELLESTHITELAQQTRVALRDSRPLLHEDTTVVLIRQDLPAQEAQVAQLTTPVHIAQIAHMSQRELADLRRVWRARRDLYEDWQHTLASKGEDIEAARTTLVDLRRTWRALRDAEMADPGRTEDRVERIATALQQVRDAASTLEAQRDDIQSIEDRVSELILTATDVGDDIRDANAAYRERLFVRDRPPLWQGLGPDVIDEGDPEWGEHVSAQIDLTREQAPAIVRLAIGTALLAAMLAWLRRRVTPELDGPTRAVAARPVATALTLGMLLEGLVVPNAPVFFGDVVAMLILAPVLRIAWAAMPASLRGLLVATAAFVVVDRTVGTMSDGSAMRRALVIAESAVFAAALLGWARLAPTNETTPRRARTLSILCGIVLAVAFGTNLFGYAFLATVLVRGTAFALGATLSLFTALVLLDALVALGMETPLARRSNGVRLHHPLISQRLHRGLSIALSLAWAVLVLGGYGLATPFFSWLDDALQAHGQFGSLDLSAGAVLGASLVLGASWIVTRFVLFVLELDLLPRVPLEPGVGGAIAGLTRYILFAIGLILSLATLGIDASQIALVAGALGVGVGFGLQGIVANFIAGLVLMLERPVRIGDRIEVGTLTGRVERIGLRSSTVRGEDGAEVIVPNETLIGREVVNWTLSDRKRRVQIDVGVAYGTDPRRVIEVVLAAVRSHTGVLTKETGGSDPSVRFTAFGPSSLDFAVGFWTAEHDQATALKSEVGILVLDALVKAGIEIPFPQQDVRVVGLPAPAAVEEG